MTRRIMVVLGVMIGCVIVLAACGTPGSALAPGRVAGVAYVDSLDVLILESFPVQVNVIVRGNLADGCTTLDDLEFTFDKAIKLFTAQLAASRPADRMCTEALVPFEESVKLDVLGLAAGTYTVKAQDVTATFTFSVDNKSN